MDLSTPIEYNHPGEFREDEQGRRYRFPFVRGVPGEGIINVQVEPVLESNLVREVRIRFLSPDGSSAYSIKPLASDGVITFGFLGDGPLLSRDKKLYSYFAGMWFVGVNEGNLFFDSHPPEGTSYLMVDSMASPITIWYE